MTKKYFLTWVLKLGHVPSGEKNGIKSAVTIAF